MHLESFSEDYSQARDRFRLACSDRGTIVDSHRCPAAGPKSEELTVDAARFGPNDATQLIVVISGTHGIEGFCGSGCQIAWIESCADRDLPDDFAVVHLHFLNPFGAAWLCVEDQDNIDLNRNFLDHDAPHPHNPRYEDLHEAFTCPEYRGPLRDRAKAMIDEYIASHGMEAFLEAAARGQYTHPEGFNFGGQGPAWSNQMLRELLARHGAGSRRIAVADIHTGVGPSGHGMLIFHSEADSDEGGRARAWYGDEVVCNDVGAIGYSTTGDLTGACAGMLPHAEVTAITLEYGTVELDRVADAMLTSFWLHRFGDPSSETGRRIGDEMRACFAPMESEWHHKVLTRFDEVLVQTVEGLSASDLRTTSPGNPRQPGRT